MVSSNFTHTHKDSHLQMRESTCTLMTFQSNSNKSLCWISQTCSAGASEQREQIVFVVRGTSWIFSGGGGLSEHSLSCYNFECGLVAPLRLIFLWIQVEQCDEETSVLPDCLTTYCCETVECQTKSWLAVTRVGRWTLIFVFSTVSFSSKLNW